MLQNPERENGRWRMPRENKTLAYLNSIILVYKISEFDEALLNRYEGYPKFYYKRYFQLAVKTLRGGRLKGNKQCMAYVLHEERQLGEPSMEYYKLLDDGYARWGFDVEILDKGLSDSIGVKPAKAYLAKFQKL